MGNILKIRKLTTFAEVGLVAIGIALVLVVVYFAMGSGNPAESKTNTGDTILPVTETPQIKDTVKATAAPVTVTTSNVETTNDGTNVVKTTSKTVKPKAPVKAQPKVTPQEKPKKKENKNGERENLEITNF